MVLLAGVKALLYRYSGDEDIIIGSPIAGREHVDLENQIGFYVNTLALRTEFSGSDSFEDLLLKVRSTCLEGYAHQLYPFDSLVESLSIERDTSRHPLFDVMVQLDTLSNSALSDMSSLGSSSYAGVDKTISKFDLTFSFSEQDSGVSLELEYNTDCLLYTSPSPRDGLLSRMPSSA